MPKILAFAGSLRAESFNKTLVNIAAEGARRARADVTVIDLSDYPMPVLNQDDEAEHGKPDTAKRLKAMMIEHDGFLIACPEYNSSITAVLKNTIDWVSRPDEGDTPGGLPAFRGKVVSLMSASPGTLGGPARPRARPRHPRQHRVYRPPGPSRDSEGARGLQ